MWDSNPWLSGYQSQNLTTGLTGPWCSQLSIQIYIKVIRCLIRSISLLLRCYGQFFDKAVSFVQTPRYLDCMYVRIAFPLFLPLPLTVFSPTATTGSLRISMCVICSLSCTHRFVKKKCSGISDNETLRPVSTLSHGVIVRQLIYLLCVCITNQISCKQENQNFGLRVGRWVRTCKCDVLVI